MCTSPSHYLHTQSCTDSKVVDAMEALAKCFQLAMEKHAKLFTSRMMRVEVCLGHTPLEKYKGWLLECFHGFNKQLTHCFASDSARVQVCTCVHVCVCVEHALLLCAYICILVCIPTKVNL